MRASKGNRGYGWLRDARELQEGFRGLRGREIAGEPKGSARKRAQGGLRE